MFFLTIEKSIKLHIPRTFWLPLVAIDDLMASQLAQPPKALRGEGNHWLPLRRPDSILSSEGPGIRWGGAWRIIPVSKCFVTAIYKPWSSAIWKGSHNPILRGQQRSLWLSTTYFILGWSSKWRPGWLDPPVTSSRISRWMLFLLHRCWSQSRPRWCWAVGWMDGARWGRKKPVISRLGRWFQRFFMFIHIWVVPKIRVPPPNHPF